MTVRLVAWAIAAACVHSAALAESAERDSADIRPFESRVVAPQVHLLSTPEDYFGPVIGNVTLIEQSDGLVIIDSGLSAANGRAVVRYARSMSDKPIKAVAITHWHNDHPQGVSAIRDAFPDVRIIATAATEAGMLGPEASNIGFAPDPRFDEAIAKLAEQSKATMQKLLDDPATAEDRKARIRLALPQFDQFVEDYRGSYIVPPTETFDRELLLDDSQRPVRLLHLGRANTDGDLVAWLPNERIVVTGDIVVAPTPFGFFSFPGDWIDTIDRIRALGFMTLIPGHGKPQTDSAYLDKLTKAITDIRAKVGPVAKSGVPLGEVRGKLDFANLVELFGDTPRNRQNLENFFIVPMMSNAYKEALGQPIIQGESNQKPEYSHTAPAPSSRKHGS